MTPKRVVAIGAHPDDVEFFAGATVAGLRAGGAHVELVICTDGARGGVEDSDALVARRRAEAGRAAAALGASGPVLLGHPDGGLVADDALRRDLVREIRRVRPGLVLAHDPTTLWTSVAGRVHLGHSDHRAAGQATLDALYPRLVLASFYPELAAEGFGPWLVREVWLFDTSAPDHFVETAPGHAAKREALRCHESQLAAGLLEGADALERGLRRPEEPAAEAFRRLVLG